MAADGVWRINMQKDKIVTFDAFVSHILEAGKDEPLCPFPFISCECYMETDKCAECEHAKNSYVQWAAKRIIDERKAKRAGARVFCISCGGGTRSPLIRWHNSYICEHCWRILRAIGEEEFMKRILKNAEA